ncbi:MAG: hypothetical protein N3G21_07085 [Candidatus Hydrogenedentes bacterium]|nr:hypothetical protein [Candidatus Hydrogenedentota bacterium]
MREEQEEEHWIDVVYREERLEHSLTRQYTPRTNGLVEWFNVGG